MSREEKLHAAIDSKVDYHHITDRAGVIDHFKDRYGTNWKSHAASHIAGTSDKSSRAYKSASRQFQKNTKTGVERYLGKESKATREKYAAIGKTLPPMSRTPKDGKITIIVSGTQANSRGRGGRSPRVIEVNFSGPDAQAFVDNPSFPAIWEQYEVNSEMFEDGTYAIDVSSVA